MDLRPGQRVRARGVVWQVLAVDRADGRDRLGLRCAEGDLTGLEWEMFVPPETVEPVEATLDPRRPSPLPLWHARHQAHALAAAAGSFVAREPGRLQVEPYQLVPLRRALDMARVRLLLADGVGLGKTVQACLIAAELIAVRRAHRVLIVVPSGPLLAQWEQETRLRFGLRFTVLAGAADLRDLRRAHERGANPFDSAALCLTALDFAKQDHVLEELERSAWDLVILDEAHHCVAHGASGSAENTHRRRLAEVLARRSDGLLLLTATPHDGDDARFASLIELLDPALVDGAGGFMGDAYRRHVVRRLKAHVRDPRTGAPLFRRRVVTPVRVDAAGDESEPARDFHRALTAFVVPRLNRRENADDTLSFVSLLKRSVSTVSACLATLRVVADRLDRRDAAGTETRAAHAERNRALRALRSRAARFGTLAVAGEAGLEALEAESMAATLRAEPAHPLAALIRLGEAAETHDPKLAALVTEIRLIRLAHPGANILVFTEYTDSQLAAAAALRTLGGEVLTMGGRDSEEARADAALRFAEEDNLILVSTDALAEGLNLQRRCFHLLHLDLPYNPNRLEQRNGRIDRYGQTREPDIRYLYFPGTFEEALLLNLIAKYEKARAALDVMPDTLGVTADPEDYGQSLTTGLSEEPDDLFKSRIEAVRARDSAAEDADPDRVAALLRETDRAFEGFDLMAVRHGWYAGRGLNAGVRGMEAPPPPASGGDLTEFVAAVIAAETGQVAADPNALLNQPSEGMTHASTTRHPPARPGNLSRHDAAAGSPVDPRIRSGEGTPEGRSFGRLMSLPRDWTPGLEGLPGFDPASATFRITRDIDAYRDAAGESVGVLGRAHPLVALAIRRAMALPGEVAVARGDRLGLLLTFAMEIPVAHRIACRRVVAVLAQSDRPPAAVEDWLSLGNPARAVSIPDAWERLFAGWAEQARADAEALAHTIMVAEHAAFAARFDAWRREDADHWRQWLRARADLLCGPFVPPTGDLFGAPPPGPSWLREEDPRARLIAFATDPATPPPQRREANDALEAARAADAADTAPGPLVSRPLGLLMLVPDDAA